MINDVADWMDDAFESGRGRGSGSGGGGGRTGKGAWDKRRAGEALLQGAALATSTDDASYVLFVAASTTRLRRDIPRLE